MSGSVFVLDKNGVPLMPMASPYARRLLKQHKAVRVPHHAFSIIKLSHVVEHPVLRPMTLVLVVGLHSAELMLCTEVQRTHVVLIRVLIDVRTDIAWRMRRRAGHRRRRRARGRYRSAQRYAVPFKARRPSLAHSLWARHHRRRSPRRQTQRHPGAVVQWRSQAIMRVVTALASWVPITHMCVRAGAEQANLFSKDTRDVRATLTARQLVRKDGARRPGCAYCGTTSQRLVIDHIVPQSREGTDALANLVLACHACNDAKGARTPDEAGMPLLGFVQGRSFRPQRAVPYVVQTMGLLRHALKTAGYEHTLHPPDDSGASIETSSTGHPASFFIAKPVGRPTKQRYAARNYPSRLAHIKPFLQVGRVVKRPLRVNQSLWLASTPKGLQARVVRQGARAAAGQHIRLGMLCQATRAGQQLRGIVVAVHSSGRLTLALPDRVHRARIYWQRVVVSPRQAGRVVSTDRVLFFPWKSNAATQSSTDDEETNHE